MSVFKIVRTQIFYGLTENCGTEYLGIIFWYTYVPNFVQIETVCLDWPVKENYQTSSSRAQKRN